MVYRSLSRDEIAMIVELELQPLRLQLAEQEMKLELTDAARLEIANAGFDPEYGARPLRRIIQNELQDELSESILANRFVPGDTIQVDYREAADEDGEMEERYVFDVIDHAPIDENDTETTEAIEAMLQ
jgi:ATP-dependent Clp protease ATP-binding subunit ClpA